MKREVIHTRLPVGRDIPVSRGTRFGNLIFTSGMAARDTKTGKLVEGDMRDVARAALENVKAIVEAGGSSMENVLSVTCYLADIDRDFAAWNEVYREYFPNDFPARTTVQVVHLDSMRIEVSAIACVTD